MDVDFKNICSLQNNAREVRKRSKSHAAAVDAYKVFRQGRSTYKDIQRNPYFKRMVTIPEVARKLEEANHAIGILETALRAQPNGPPTQTVTLAAFTTCADTGNWSAMLASLVEMTTILKQAWQYTWTEFLAAKRPLINPRPDTTFAMGVTPIPNRNFVAIVAFPDNNLLWIAKAGNCQKYIANSIAAGPLETWTPVADWPWERFLQQKKERAFGKY